ncbi:MAG TPA: ribulose-phosphate 3-epimerase [Solirubrobacteraceae bacterium]|nr:ribulose-phosphate 3-epimerase [Solirubrobacteraceae bacterium]
MTAPLEEQPRVAPSILAADFDSLGEQVQLVLDAGARVIHVDVMDGHFVPPITMGPIVVESLRERVHAAGAMLEAHLMIERPERQIEVFAKAGADLITIHAEATPHLDYALSAIRAAGAAAGLALCPSTPVEVLAEVAERLDLALCMTVNPGWGGQSFIEASIGRIERAHALLGEALAIEVDGGIEPHTAERCRAAGARVFVAGTAVFGADDPAAAYAAIAGAVGDPRR